MIIVRVTPEPSITTVCTGMSAAGGITMAMIPSRITPPAAPVNTPIKPVTSDAAVSPANSKGPISGVPRKSIRFRRQEAESADLCSAHGLHHGDKTRSCAARHGENYHLGSRCVCAELAQFRHTGEDAWADRNL